MRSRRDLLPIGEILELPLRWSEVAVVFLPSGLSHRMNQDAVAIGHGGDEAGGNVVLRVKNTGRLQVPIVSLGPKLSSGLDVDQLRGHSDARATFANASL